MVMARYKIGKTESDAEISAGAGDAMTVTIDGRRLGLRIMSERGGWTEFALDGKYYRVRYVDASSSSLELLVDGVPVAVGLHPGLDGIVYKNAGGAGAEGGVQTSLRSKIPGKVVSVSVSEGDQVSEGDPVCTLESMKMQVSVTAHRSGKVTSVKASEGGNVAKGDTIVEIS